MRIKTEKRKAEIAEQVKDAVTPKQQITKKELCELLDISRPTLNERIADGDFNYQQCKKLKELKIIK